MKDPVDELAEIRERKQLLSELEKELREIINCDEGVRAGLSYVANVSEQTTAKPGWKELAISLGATQPLIDNFSSETLPAAVPRQAWLREALFDEAFRLPLNGLWRGLRRIVHHFRGRTGRIVRRPGETLRPDTDAVPHVRQNAKYLSAVDLK